VFVIPSLLRHMNLQDRVRGRLLPGIVIAHEEQQWINAIVHGDEFILLTAYSFYLERFDEAQLECAAILTFVLPCSSKR